MFRTLFLALLISPSIAQTYHRPDSISQSSCDGVVNDVNGIPRLDFNGKIITNDWGKYDWMECSQTSPYDTRSSCSFFSPSLDLTTLTDQSTDEASPLRLVQGYVSLVAFGIFMCLIVLIIGLCLLGRYYCCCVKGGCCGGRYPKHKTKWLGTGVHQSEDQSIKQIWKKASRVSPAATQSVSETIDKSMKSSTYVGYSSRSRWCTRAFNYVFVIFMVVWILLCYASGINQLAEKLIAVKEAPRPIANLVQSINQPIKTVLINLSSGTIPLVIQAINQTINQSVDLNQINQNLQCVIYQVDHNLPNVTLINQSIDQTISQFSNLQTIANASFLDSFQLSINQTNNQTALLIVKLNNMMIPINQSIAIRDNVTVSINQFNSFVSQATSSSTGVPSLINDLYTVSNMSNPSINQTISQAINQSTVLSMAAMTFGESTNLYNNLVSIQSTYQAMPNFSVTAGRLVDLQTRSLQTDSIFQSIEQSFSQLDQSLDMLVANLIATNQSISQLQSTVQSVDITSAINLMQLVNQTITQSINLSLIINQLELIHPLMQVVPCLDQLLVSIQSVNQSIIQLPSSFEPILQLAPQFNQSINQSINQVDDIITELNGYQITLTNLSIGGLIDRLIDMRQLINDTNAQFETAKQTINQTINQSNNQSVSDSSQFVSSINSTISNLTTIDVNSISLLQPLKQSTLDGLSILVPDINQFYTRGFCSLDGLQCSVDADCAIYQSNNQQCRSSSPSINPVKRCRSNGTITCSVDSDCSVTDRCLTDRNRLQSLALNLTAMQTTAPWVVTLINQLESINQSIGQSDVLSLTNGIDSVINSFQSINQANLINQLNQVSSTLSNLDISQYSTELESINDSIDLPTNGPLSQLDDAINQAIEATIQIKDAQQLIANIQFILNSQLPQSLESINQSNLNRLFDEGGLNAMIDQMLRLVDQATLSVNQPSYLEPTDLVNSLLTDDIRNYINILSTNQSISQGATYFFASLAISDQLVDPNDPSINRLMYRYDKDINGNSYPDDKYCLTDSCIEQSVRYYTSKSLDQSSDQSIPVTMNPVTLLNLLLIVPAVITVIALFTPLLYKSPFWTSCLASVNLCIMFIFMLITFLFIGLLWPLLVVLTSDACHGGMSVANQYVHAESSSLCDSLSGDMIMQSNNQPACQVSALNVTFALDLPTTFESIFGDRCGSMDPLASLFASIKQSAVTMPAEQVDDALVTINQSNDQFRIRPALLNILHNAAVDAGRVLETGVSDVATALSCDNLSASVKQVKNHLMCQPVTSVYWSLSPWYLMAFTMLLCGMPASLLGRKRFANSIWGPAATKLVAANNFDIQIPPQYVSQQSNPVTEPEQQSVKVAEEHKKEMSVSRSSSMNKGRTLALTKDQTNQSINQSNNKSNNKSNNQSNKQSAERSKSSRSTVSRSSRSSQRGSRMLVVVNNSPAQTMTLAQSDPDPHKASINQAFNLSLNQSNNETTIRNSLSDSNAPPAHEPAASSGVDLPHVVESQPFAYEYPDKSDESGEGLQMPAVDEQKMTPERSDDHSPDLRAPISYEQPTDESHQLFDKPGDEHKEEEVQPGNGVTYSYDMTEEHSEDTPEQQAGDVSAE